MSPAALGESTHNLFAHILIGGMSASYISMQLSVLSTIGFLAGSVLLITFFDIYRLFLLKDRDKLRAQIDYPHLIIGA